MARGGWYVEKRLTGVLSTYFECGEVYDCRICRISQNVRSSALVNSARWAIWLKARTGDTVSKIKLCGLPCASDFLFGRDLETVLDRTANRKPSPSKRKLPPKKNLRAVPQSQRGRDQKNRWSSQRGTRRGGVLFRPPDQPAKSKWQSLPSGRKVLSSHSRREQPQVLSSSRTVTAWNSLRPLQADITSPIFQKTKGKLLQ